ncbi:MAG: glucokinase [Phycisphaerae bacterium]|nr:glucokinase [Phycisphaerae bacterium]
MILAGDVGGTNSRLGLFDDNRRPIFESTHPNAGKSGLPAVVAEFLNKAGTRVSTPITRACFGVAGPVSGGKVTLTNLQWTMDEASLSTALKIPKVALINDMVAHAEGVELLGENHLVTLNEAAPIPQATRAIIAAGTGLGEGAMVWDSGHNGYRAVPSEGGHSDFSPRNDQEIALLKFMLQRQPTVSWEHVLSGPGTRNLYDFLISPGQLGSSAALADPDPTPAAITQAALAKSNAACIAALNMMAELYGAEAGNLAVTLLATGGVYIGGGIGIKILPLLKQSVFFERFWQRGPNNLRALLKAMPIFLINFDGSGLYGAANFASRL